MFLGHLGLSYAGKRLQPALPLWLLATATVLSDGLMSVFGLVASDEQAGDWSHSLPAALIASAAVTVIATLIAGRRSGLVLGGLTLSHIVADYLTSSMELWRGGPKFGLHLYHWRGADFALEAVTIVGCWWVYRATLPPHPKYRWAAWAGMVFLVVVQAIFDFATPIGA